MADIETLKQENRIFNPPAEFVGNATISGMDAYKAMCAKAEQDYEGFWATLANDNIQWKKPFTKTLNEADAPFYKWFEDGQLNVSYNCLDRNLQNGNADKTAVVFESDDGKSVRVTYQELHDKVCQFANGLKSLGIRKGDRVVIYMPMSVEGIVAMQACARIGAGTVAVRNEQTGYFTITGRIDDVLNVSGHRMGTMEIESALVTNPLVAEAAVVGKPDETTGESICATGSARRSARLPSRRRSVSATTCRRRARARSCGACCVYWPRASRSLRMSPRSKIRPSWNRCGRRNRPAAWRAACAVTSGAGGACSVSWRLRRHGPAQATSRRSPPDPGAVSRCSPDRGRRSDCRWAP